MTLKTLITARIFICAGLFCNLPSVQQTICEFNLKKTKNGKETSRSALGLSRTVVINKRNCLLGRIFVRVPSVILYCFNVVPARRQASSLNWFFQRFSESVKAQWAVFNLVAIRVLVLHGVLVITLVLSFLMFNPNLSQKKLSDRYTSISSCSRRAIKPGEGLLCFVLFLLREWKESRQEPAASLSGLQWQWRISSVNYCCCLCLSMRLAGGTGHGPWRGGLHHEPAQRRSSHQLQSPVHQQNLPGPVWYQWVRRRNLEGYESIWKLTNNP